MSFKGRKKFALVVDGDCEFWYFQMLKRNHRNIGVDLKPEIPQKKKLADQFAKVKDYANIYDKVIWVIDFDVLAAETRKAKKGAMTAIQEFKIYKEFFENSSNVKIIVNNSCLEFWLLLHFEATSRYFDSCEGAEKQLKKHLPAYQKTEKFYTGQNQDIFLKLKPYLNTAIANAKKLKPFTLENTQTGVSEMNQFFEMDLIKVIL